MGKTFCLPVFGRKNKPKMSSPKYSVTSDAVTSEESSTVTTPVAAAATPIAANTIAANTVGPEDMSSMGQAKDHDFFQGPEDMSSMGQAKSSSNSLEDIVASPSEANYANGVLSNNDVSLKHEEDAAAIPDTVGNSVCRMLEESELYLSDPCLYSCATSEGSHNDTSAGLRDDEAPMCSSCVEIEEEPVQVPETFQGDEDTPLSRVEQWVKSIELEDQLLPVETSSSKSSSHSHTSVHHKDLELANNVARALDYHSSVAHLSGIGLTVIPSLGAFSHLKVLKLAANSISKISTGSLPKSLQLLDLSRNKISVIEGLRELTRLRILNLSHNRISRIGKGLANCTSIRELHLAGNKISEVEGLHRLTKLIFLDLSFNRLSSNKSLDQIAASYSSLLALDLVGNPVVSNHGEEQLKRFLLSFTPNLVYLNRRPVSKSGGISRDSALLLKALVPSSSLMASSRYSPSSSSAPNKVKNHHYHQQQSHHRHHKSLQIGGMQRVKSEGAIHE